MPSPMSEVEFNDVKRAYTEAIPAGDALKHTLKEHNKEQKSRISQIHSYMRENNIMSADIGGITFEREEKTTLPLVVLVRQGVSKKTRLHLEQHI